MAKQSISVTLEPETIENLKRMAAAEYRNVSNMIDYIVAQYVIQKSAEKNGAGTVPPRTAVNTEDSENE